MGDDNSTETGDNTNNSSTDNTEDTNIKKGIEKCNMSTTASTKNNSISVNNEADITTDDGDECTVAHPNNHHIHTSNTSQQGDKLENVFKKNTHTGPNSTDKSTNIEGHDIVRTNDVATESIGNKNELNEDPMNEKHMDESIGTENSNNKNQHIRVLVYKLKTQTVL